MQNLDEVGWARDRSRVRAHAGIVHRVIGDVMEVCAVDADLLERCRQAEIAGQRADRFVRRLIRFAKETGDERELVGGVGRIPLHDSREAHAGCYTVRDAIGAAERVAERVARARAALTNGAPA